MSNEQYTTRSIHKIRVGDPLPAPVYVHINERYIIFRGAGDIIDRQTFDKLEFKRVENLFIKLEDQKKFDEWVSGPGEPAPLAGAPEAFLKAREDLHRKTLDIFQSNHPDEMIGQIMGSSKKLVSEVMKFPYATQTLAQLQNYSKGTVDHSVNVSILSVYLAMQMGYSHHLILQHVGVGGLLHDIGKTKVQVGDNDSNEVSEKKMREHSNYSLRMLENLPKVPDEVKMIVGQHHECADGTGFPKKLRGNQIYDLARIVSIANVFDEIVGDGKGTLVERQRTAVLQLDQVLYKQFDSAKLDKAVKILKLGI